MWHTSRGDRTLRGSEAALVSLAIDTMIDALLVHLDEEEEAVIAPECQSGISVYDSLTASQRIGLLHDVARHLLTDTKTILPLSATTEAAVAAIYTEVRDQVAIEIDLYSEKPQQGLPSEALFWRRAVSAAYQSLSQITHSNDPTWNPLVRIDHFLADGAATLPTTDSSDLEVWETLIDDLTDAILWDRDFELADSFLDIDPTLSLERRRLMGIDRDYFTYVAPDPRPDQVMRLIWNTRDILRSKPR
ncbi:hypothetical protein Q31b_54240 [Novipirellula aureliae]|uniref:Uncharacterized protein n=1 Tax=Novipirellula aureliae TaxID=2527966 RepID=A0A5C6DF52_9BACT|nr:hypothetical protein [Novipirellula aureliae]TWU35328.1 hypothetical protein Q31b_54240 [Novipirellula aureliae]